MRMVIKISIFLSTINFLGYSQDINDKFNAPWRNCKTAIIRNANNDPIIRYEKKQIKILFDSLNSVIYVYYRRFDKSNKYYYKFSIADNDLTFFANNNHAEKYRLIDKKSIFLENDIYEIYKFSNINPPVDGGLFLFFSPTFGIICEKSTAWFNYFKMVSISGLEKDHIISQLIELIFYDEIFFNSYFSKEYNDSLLYDRFKKYERNEKQKLDSIINIMENEYNRLNNEIENESELLIEE